MRQRIGAGRDGVDVVVALTPDLREQPLELARVLERLVMLAAGGPAHRHGAHAESLEPEDGDFSRPIAGILVAVEGVQGYAILPIRDSWFEAASELGRVGEDVHEERRRAGRHHPSSLHVAVEPLGRSVLGSRADVDGADQVLGVGSQVDRLSRDHDDHGAHDHPAAPGRSQPPERQQEKASGQTDRQVHRHVVALRLRNQIDPAPLGAERNHAGQKHEVDTRPCGALRCGTS